MRIPPISLCCFSFELVFFGLLFAFATTFRCLRALVLTAFFLPVFFIDVILLAVAVFDFVRFFLIFVLVGIRLSLPPHM